MSRPRSILERRSRALLKHLPHGKTALEWIDRLPLSNDDSVRFESIRKHVLLAHFLAAWLEKAATDRVPTGMDEEAGSRALLLRCVTDTATGRMELLLRHGEITPDYDAVARFAEAAYTDYRSSAHLPAVRGAMRAACEQATASAKEDAECRSLLLTRPYKRWHRWTRRRGQHTYCRTRRIRRPPGCSGTAC